MNTHDNVAKAQAYYTAMANKDDAEIEKYLHSDVHLIGPYGEKRSKEIVFDAAKKFMHMFKNIHIHSCFGYDDHVALTYDLIDFAKPGNTLRAASIMTFKDGAIIKNELFFDTASIQ